MKMNEVKKRNEKPKILNANERFQILENAGVPTMQIVRAVQEAGSIRSRREKTTVKMKFSRVEEAIESGRRKLKRFLLRQKPNRKKRELCMNNGQTNSLSTSKNSKNNKVTQISLSVLNELRHTNNTHHEGLSFKRRNPIIIVEED